MRQQRFWRKFLMEEERLLHAFGRSRVYLILYWFFPAIAAGVAAWYFNEFISEVIAWLLVMMSGVLLIAMIYQWLFVRYCVTSRRVMGSEGWLWKRLVIVDLRQITDITVSEPLIERIVARAGTIGVNTAGHNGTELTLAHIARPIKKRADLYHHLHEITGQTEAPQN